MKILLSALVIALLMTTIVIGVACQPERMSSAQIAQKKATQAKLDAQKKAPEATSTPEDAPPTPAAIPTPAEIVPEPEPGPTLKTSVLPVTDLPDEAPEVYYVKFECSNGEMLFKCTKEWAPIGAQHFYDLVKVAFYDGCRFFRVVTKPSPFVIQFGLAADPLMNEQYGATIQDEPVIKSNTPGTLTFAKSGQPNSRSTQLFINLADNSRLDAIGFSAFGELVEGREAINKTYTGYGEAPSKEQDSIRNHGNAFLNQKYPKLSYINKAYIVTLAQTDAAETDVSEPAPEAAGSENKEQ